MESNELTHYKNEPFTASWRWILAACDGDLYQANVVSIIEYFANAQATRIAKDRNIADKSQLDKRVYYVSITYADFLERGLSRRACETAVFGLINRGFIRRFMEAGKSCGAYYYALNYSEINRATETARQKMRYSRDWTPRADLEVDKKEFVQCDKIELNAQGTKKTPGREARMRKFSVCETNPYHLTGQGMPNDRMNPIVLNDQHCKTNPYHLTGQSLSNDRVNPIILNGQPYHLIGSKISEVIDNTAAIDEKTTGISNIIYITIEQQKNKTNTTKPQTQLGTQHCTTPPSRQQQPAATPMATADDVHPQTQPSASSSDETDGACITKHQKLATGENSRPVPTSTPSGNFLFSSEVVEKSTSPDSTQETDTPSEDPKNSWRPAASCENQLQCDVAASENKIEAEVASDSGGLKEPIGFRVDLVEVAPRAAAPDESRESVTPSAKSRRGSDQVYFNRSWIGYRDDDPDVRDQSLKDQKGKGRRPEESKKKRCPAFRATRKPMASADIWVEIIRERYDFGEYPKSVTPEIIALAEYWIRGLYKAEPRVAAELDMMDGYPQIIAKVLEVHGKTPRQFRAVSDYIRSTAGSLDFDWSCRILSPDALNQRTRTNNRVYINHILDMVERNGASGVAAGRGGQMNQPQQEATLGYEGMGRERKLQDLKARMSKAHNAGFWMYLNINRMHSNGDVRGLEDIVPQDMWHFVEEYREITGWKKEVA